MSKKITSKKHAIWYYLSDPKNQMRPAFSEDDFKEAAKELWKLGEGWVAEQNFYDNGSISEYRSIVIDVSNSSSDRVEEVKELYGIYPDELFVKWESRYIIFRFKRWINSRSFYHRWQVLCTLYNIIHDEEKIRTSYPYQPDNVYPLGQISSLVGQLELILEWIDDSKNRIYDDIANKKEIDKANEIDKHDVLKKLGNLTKDKIDTSLDLIVWYGSVYTYVLKKFWDTDRAYEFFNTEYWTNFTTGAASIDRFMKVGVISDGGELHQKWYSLWYEQNWDFKQITDFIPRVHYRLQRKDCITYIITVVGEGGEQKKFIEVPNDSSETALQKWIQWHGNYHITGGKTAVTKFHKYLSSARVPTIYTIDKFWDIEIQWKRYIAYADALYEVESGRVIHRYPNTSFYMISTIVGIRIEDNNKKDLMEALTIKSPMLGPAKENSPKDFIDFFSQFYSDDSRFMIPFIAATWLGHLLYKPATSCPMFFVTGPTGSGKTTFTKLLSRMYGIEKPVSLEEATTFPIRFCLTQLDWLPVFFNEYRQKMQSAYEKTQIFKALFDGTPFERGRKDLWVDTFVFSANGFLEWEELPDSGATRTRLIIHKTRVDGIKKGSNPEQAMQEHAEFLNSFQYSYFTATDKEEYFDFYNEWKKIFAEIPCPSARVFENICLMYAGVMAFFKEYKDKVIEVLEKLMRQQVEDFERNSTGVEFIKAMGQYVGSRFPNIYFSGNCLVLSWADLTDFIEQKRIKLELGVDWYRDHLEAMGWELWYFEVKDANFWEEDILIDGAKIPIIKVPMQLRCNPKIYRAFKEFSKHIYTP